MKERVFILVKKKKNTQALTSQSQTPVTYSSTTAGHLRILTPSIQWGLKLRARLPLFMGLGWKREWIGLRRKRKYWREKALWLALCQTSLLKRYVGHTMHFLPEIWAHYPGKCIWIFSRAYSTFCPKSQTLVSHGGELRDQILPNSWETELHFCFFRNGRALEQS